MTIRHHPTIDVPARPGARTTARKGCSSLLPRLRSGFRVMGAGLLLACALVGRSRAGTDSLDRPLPEAALPASLRYILGSSVNLRESRDEGSHIAGALRIGTPVTVLETHDDVARVRTDGGDEGWMAAELLTESLPTVEDCLAQAKAMAKPTQALVWTLRAHGLAPWDRNVIAALEAAYRAVGETEKADGMARQLDYAGPLLLGACDVGSCDVWLELVAGRFHAYAISEDTGKSARASRQVREMDGWFYLQADLAEGWVTPAGQAWKRVKGRDRLTDVSINGGLLISRLTRPVRPEYVVPAPAALRARVADVLLETSPRAGWLADSRTGPTPVSVKVWPVTSAMEEPVLAIEARFDLKPADGKSAAGRYGGVLIARLQGDGSLLPMVREGVLAPAKDKVALRSARLRGAADLDGDGRAEVLVTSGTGPSERLEAVDQLWRARIHDDRVEWKREVSSASGVRSSTP